MSQPEAKLVKPVDFAIDVVVTGGFFAYMFTLFRSHVPSNDPQMITLWAALSSACISGVFWLACWMLRMVYRHQKQLAAGK
ncbi:hypothetical protein MASR2M8_00680 [Opitutaceae bacterium]